MNERFRGRPRERRFSPTTIAAFVALLVLPALAVIRLARIFDLRWAGVYFVIISAATYLLYRHDKQRAQSGGWRIPESTLHLCDLFGGWPAAFIAQRTLRHKTAKTSYQGMFWLIVVLHQLLSFDFLQNWKWIRLSLLWLR